MELHSAAARHFVSLSSPWNKDRVDLPAPAHPAASLPFRRVALRPSRPGASGDSLMAKWASGRIEEAASARFRVPAAGIP
jgi:hypothetical protein